MSTSILYHCFSIRGYTHQSTAFEGSATFFKIEQAKTKLRCSSCGSKNIIRHGQKQRQWQTVPIGSKPIFILFGIPCVECRDCGLIRQVKVDFAQAHKRHTKSFERHVLDLLQHMTIKSVSEHLSVSWDLVKNIQKQNLRKHFSKPKLKALKQIAIDEIAVKKGHTYLTVVMDLASGAIVFVGDGKSSKALEPFWKRLKHSRAEIKAVACDLSRAYIKAVKENLPDAALVFDRFHVTKLMNDKLSKLRTELHQEADEDEKKNHERKSLVAG